MLLHPMPVDNVTIFGPPIKLLTEGKFLTVPVMFGFTKDEGAMIGKNSIYLQFMPVHKNFSWQYHTVIFFVYFSASVDKVRTGEGV